MAMGGTTKRRKTIVYQLKTKTYTRHYSRDAIDLSRGRAREGGPKVAVIDADGNRVIERRPPGQHMDMVKPSGNVSAIMLCNGSGRPNADDPYKMKQLQRKLARGFIPTQCCPKEIGMQRWVPEPHRDGAPCRHSTDRDGRVVPISDAHPCECVKSIIAIRVEAQRAKTAADENRYKSGQDRANEVREEEVGHLSEAVKQLAGALGDKKVKGSK